jgi:hypothetical protein
LNNISEILNFIGTKFGTITVTKSSVSSLPVTISSNKILAKHKPMTLILSNPSAQQGVWSATCTAGQLQITGTISGTTDIEVGLEIETDTITG